MSTDTETTPVPPVDKIRGPAIRKYGLVFWQPIPASHHSLATALTGVGVKRPLTGEQGFTTIRGLFLDRREALRVADAAGQIVNRISGGDELFSEWLWLRDEAGTDTETATGTKCYGDYSTTHSVPWCEYHCLPRIECDLRVRLEAAEKQNVELTKRLMYANDTTIFANPDFVFMKLSDVKSWFDAVTTGTVRLYKEDAVALVQRLEAAEKRAEEAEQENRKLRSEAADAELRGLAAEMRKVRELVQSSDSYVPQDVAAECLLMLESVGLDKAGHGNTLLSMVTSAVERIADLRSRELTESGLDGALQSLEDDVFHHGGLPAVTRQRLREAILSARGSRP
jgi:hypothetical protein